MLPREPGKRESRYAHQFSGEIEQQNGIAADSLEANASEANVSGANVSEANLSQTDAQHDLLARVEALEEEVKSLRRELLILKGDDEE